jgi:DNA-binding transcriptional LysR family regulator
VQEIEHLTDPSAGELRIAATEPMLAGLVPTVIDRLSRQYPRIVFQVIRAPTDYQQYRPLRERDVELIVGRLPSAGMQDDLAVEILFNEPLLVGAGVQNRWLRRRRIELAELVDEPWVLPQPDHFIGALSAELFHACGLQPPKNAVICSSIHMNDALVAMGRYLAVYSESLLRLSSTRLPIKPLSVELPIKSTPVAIVTLKNRTFSPIASLFVRQLREVAKSLTRPRLRGR